MSLVRKEKIKFVLIGCGSIAKKHIAAIKNIENAEVVGAYDINQSINRNFCASHSIPFYRNQDELMEIANPHALLILTPSG